MALAATTVWEVETTGSDTLNGGAFDPGQTAGMFTDGAATVANTSAPVFTSASYNFVAGDVAAWVYIASGTNWTAGWYKISSVAANAATLNGTIGQGVLKTVLTPTTVVGCATTASPTGATWTIDYSQQASAQFAYTDLVSAGTGLTVSSVLKPFAKQQVGNSLVITGGTNFNTGRYVIASVAAVTFIATVVGPTNITTGAGATGTGGLGGALASPGIVGGVFVDSNHLFIRSGSYTVTSASTNIAVGCFSNSTSAIIQGYGSVRGDFGTKPTITASGINTFVLMAATGAPSSVSNLSFVDTLSTSGRGLQLNAGYAYKITASGFTNSGILSGGAGIAVLCSVTGCSTQIALRVGRLVMCESYTNTITGADNNGQTGYVQDCIFSGNTGTTSDGYQCGTGGSLVVNTVLYGNGRDGLRNTGGSTAILSEFWINCIAEANGVSTTGIGFNDNGRSTLLSNCAAFNSGQTNFSLTGASFNLNSVTGTTTFFTNAASRDFSLNNTAATGGALARATGVPGIFPAGTTTGYLDIGAAQHADPAAAGLNLYAVE